MLGEQIKLDNIRGVEVKITGKINGPTYIAFYEVEKLLNKIEVTKEPTKTDYIEGEDFDSTNMIVTATYSDGSTKEVTDYTIINGTDLKKEQTSVEIRYTEGSVTKSTEQLITVIHQHVWDDGEVTTEPTCKDKGEKTYTCTTCGETKTEEIEVTEEHAWNAGEITKEPTCIEKGEITYICTICDETRKEDIAETGHKYENDACINCGEDLFTEESKYYIISSDLIGINPNTPFIKFIENIMTKYTAKIFKDMLEITEGNIATGMSVKIFEEEKEIGDYTAVVTGDTDGDGDANIKDMIKINNYRLYGTTNNFEGVYQTAADVNRDKNIDIKDMIRINNYRLYGTSL